MKARTTEIILKRTLFIDFDFFTDNDPHFKQELIVGIIDNLQELQQAYGLSATEKDLDIYLITCHKMKTTLFMLADNEFEAIVEDLKNPLVGPHIVSQFNTLIAEIIVALLDEKM